MAKSKKVRPPTEYLHQELQIRGFDILRWRWKLGWVTQELCVKTGQLDVIGKRPNQRFIYIIECKANRADLLGDIRSKKWTRYLPYCNSFWFYVNRGICDVSEIPEQAGLIEATDSDHVLYRTRRRAPVLEMEPDNYLEVIESMFSAMHWRPTLPRRLIDPRKRKEDRHFRNHCEDLENEIKFLVDKIDQSSISIDVPQVKIRVHVNGVIRKFGRAKRELACPGCGKDLAAWARNTRKGRFVQCYDCQQYLQIAGEVRIKEEDA